MMCVSFISNAKIIDYNWHKDFPLSSITWPEYKLGLNGKEYDSGLYEGVITLSIDYDHNRQMINFTLTIDDIVYLGKISSPIVEYVDERGYIIYSESLSMHTAVFTIFNDNPNLYIESFELIDKLERKK